MKDEKVFSFIVPVCRFNRFGMLLEIAFYVVSANAATTVEEQGGRKGNGKIMVEKGNPTCELEERYLECT